MRELRGRCIVAVVTVFSFIGSVGCGGPGASISGKVTLDGTPLDEATITFVPTSGGQRDAGWAPVQGGNYSIPLANGLGTGPFRVEIRALRSGGANQNDPELIAAKEIVPSRYNSKSELTVEVKPGPNSASFELKTK